MQPYLYESSKNKELAEDEAIVVLPDIYCQTDYSKRTVEEFTDVFKRQVFMLDYFYLSTGQANVLAETDREQAQSLMKEFDANKFVPFFKKVLEEIKEVYPAIKKFVVIGFCFGGRLAYIAGGEKEVSKIIPFYGGGALTPGYVEGKTSIDYLISKRKSDNLRVASFFGLNDQSIPESDRQEVKDKLTQAGIEYSGHEYNAGHAYFQEGRLNYNPEAHEASWSVLHQILQLGHGVSK